MRVPRVGEVRKLVAFLVTVAGNLLALSLVPEQAEVWVVAAVNVAGAYGIYALPNDDAPVASE